MDLANTLDRELLKFAVQRALFCPVCKDILDTRDAVLAEFTSPVASGSAAVCGSCFDKAKASFNQTGWSVRVECDGRKVKEAK